MVIPSKVSGNVQNQTIMRQIISILGIIFLLVGCEKRRDTIIIKSEKFDNDTAWNFETIDPSGLAINEISDGSLRMHLRNTQVGTYFLLASAGDTITHESYDRFGFVLKLKKGQFYHYSDGITKTNYGSQFSFYYGNMDIRFPICNLIEPHDVELNSGYEFEIEFEDGTIDFKIDGMKMDPGLVLATNIGSLYSNHIRITVESKNLDDFSKEILLEIDEIEFYTW